MSRAARGFQKVPTSGIGRFCCKTLCCAANAQLSNPRSRHLESDIAHFGSSLNQCCASGVSKIVLQQYRPEAANNDVRSDVRYPGIKRTRSTESEFFAFWPEMDLPI